MASETYKDHADYDYIIVGSGPGGGPLAANLARHGHKVLLLEAGDDQGDNLEEKIPAFFAVFEEDPQERWDFFVKHFNDEKQAAKDPKMCWKTPEGGFFVGTDPPAGSKQLGIWYPRAGTVGGCAAHNGLVAVLPPDADWENIANITGDESWRPKEIRRFFERLERCLYLHEGTVGHGFEGWLETNLADESTLKAGEPFISSALSVVSGKKGSHGLIKDINGLNPERKDGVYRPAMTMSRIGRRSSPRNYLVATSNAKNADGGRKYPLFIRTHCFATRILFDEASHHGKPRAVGVEFLEGQSMYKADPRFNTHNVGVKRTAHARKEVIVACGTFNTPQLLKLSGIGPRDELENLGIDVVVDLPGVGENLQDNYEFGVVAQSSEIISSFSKGTGLTAGDPLLRKWFESGGPYASNGVAAAVLHTSSVAQGDPDLLVVGGAFEFTGFFPGFSKVAFSTLNDFTWDVLKIRPRNKAGTVKLRSKDPQDVPEINFNFFHEGGRDDIEAMFEGVELARKIYEGVSMPDGPLTEINPGPSVRTEAQVKQSIKNEAFGHHAACTCSIGANNDEFACLDSRFRVRGVDGLRVVDASAFPRVPGAFPTLATAILSEKATEVILEDAMSSSDDKVLDGVRELEILVEDAKDDHIVFEQARLEGKKGKRPLESDGQNGTVEKKRSRRRL